MTSSFKKVSLPITLFLILFGLLTSYSATLDIPALQQQAYVRPHKSQPISTAASDFWAQRTGDKIKVWVFFTDKAVFTQGDFISASASVQIPARSLARRAKVGLDKVVFADLPVVQEYIDRISALGAEPRRVSRWLNAASYEIDYNLLDEIKALPFVAEIKPMAGFKKEYPESTPLDTKQLEAPEALGSNSVSYGYTEEQLTQINVPQVHNRGYSGSGVTLAVFDTGFRKTHEAFAAAYAQGRVLGEYDFVFGDGNTANEAGDLSSQWNHGTGTWAIAGGYKSGIFVGPAYAANFLLAKTEDERSETPVEEDNWVAALEWADSAGADVITSSLGYSDWYTFADMDGLTATTTIAANTADGLGIVVCNSMGNDGPAYATLSAPADAFNILAVGAVSSTGAIASFSSRGPASDGRTKPEVCARGVNTSWASASADNAYGTNNGTSLSTPLVAGAVCLLIEAHPDYTPELIRESLKRTASRSDMPDNNYGWGIIDAEAALDWGVNFGSDVAVGDAPLDVNFTDESTLDLSSWHWDFGDGDTSNVQNPSHHYADPGAYPVSLTIESTEFGTMTNEKLNYIVALADTITGENAIADLNDTVAFAIDINSNIELDRIQLPIEFDGPVDLTYLGMDITGTLGEAFHNITYINYDAGNKHMTLDFTIGENPPLPPGHGTLVKVLFEITGADSVGAVTTMKMDGYNTYEPRFYATSVDYQPKLSEGTITRAELGCCEGLVGNVNCSESDTPDVSDIVRLIDYLYLSKEPLCCPEEADINVDGAPEPDITDIVDLIDALYITHAALATCP